ncbi:MAG TPA: iron-sulfur cluster assembly scaffold protein [Pyrinomonadaceae bacterium]|nr:iron-sulfur cluster assembly scaffold protein [Pyrinomonadaceae bacterium]
MSYSAKFKDHLAHPRNVGELPGANAIADETNPICGDRLRLSLIITGDHIETARYLAYGCPPTLVCGSVLTELITGKYIAEVKQLTRADLLEAMGGLPSRKHHAAALAIETLNKALEPGINAD